MSECFPTSWKWPLTKDEIYYKKEKNLKKINPSTPTDTRGGWQFKDSVLKNY